MSCDRSILGSFEQFAKVDDPVSPLTPSAIVFQLSFAWAGDVGSSSSSRFGLFVDRSMLRSMFHSATLGSMSGLMFGPSNTSHIGVDIPSRQTHPYRGRCSIRHTHPYRSRRRSEAVSRPRPNHTMETAFC